MKTKRERRRTDTSARRSSEGRRAGTSSRRAHRRLRWASVATLLTTLAFLHGCGVGPYVEPEPAPKGPIRIGLDGRGDYGTIAEAVQEAPAGATIILSAGTYRLTAPLDVYRSLTIVGAGQAGTIVESTTRGHVLGFSGNGRLALRDLTLRHLSRGSQSDPADVLLVRGGSVAIERCLLEGATVVQEGRFAGRGGAGVRLLGDTRATVRAVRTAGNDLAGIAYEPHAKPLVTKTDLSHNGVAGTYELRDREGPTDAAELGAFLDRTLPKLMKDLRIPGSVVVVVKDGSVMLSRGYGLANVSERTLVDPERTLFRVASLTKLVTATAVLQLVDRGLLELERSIDSYLPGLLPRAFGEPISVADLLRHSSGLDERTIGIAATNHSRPLALTSVLRDTKPKQVVPAGLLYSYSNYNYAVAGALIEKVTGISYTNYVRRFVLRPLRMAHSTFQPSEDDSTAPGYRWRNGRFVALPRDNFVAAPAAQLYSTGADMARLMLCHLRGGELDGVRILSEASSRLVLAPSFAAAPQLPAASLVYSQELIANRSLWKHTGDWGGYASLVALLPEDDLGLFLVANAGQEQLREELLERLMHHYYPDRDRLYGVKPPRTLSTRLERFAGTYRTLRMAHTTLDKWLAFERRKDLSVAVDGSGALTIRDTRFVQIEPLIFREQYGESHAVFRTAGTTSDMYLAQGSTSYQRLRWYETYVFHRRLIIGFVIVLGTTFLAWLATPLLGHLRRTLPWVRRLGWRRPVGYVEPRAAGMSRAIAGLVATLDLGFLAGAAGLITPSRLQYGVPAEVVALLAVPVGATGLTAAMLVFAGLAWWRRHWGLPGRLMYTFVTLIAMLFVWFLTFWNLLGFRF